MDDNKEGWTVETITCDTCGVYQGTARQVNMHKIHCKPAVPEPVPEPEPPARERTVERKGRVPFGAPRRKFNAPEKDGFQYRIFNDNWSKEPGRIQRALEAGYEIVQGREPINVGKNDDGSAIKGILMRIPEQWYREDQALKQKESDRIDEAIKRGKIEEKPGDNRYIPDGIRVWSNTSEPQQ